jgi:hypothetical protein
LSKDFEGVSKGRTSVPLKKVKIEKDYKWISALVDSLTVCLWCLMFLWLSVV